MTFQGLSSNGGIGLPIYDFLLVPNSNRMSISHRLPVLHTLKFWPYRLSLGQPPPPPYHRHFFSKSIHFCPGSTETSHQK